MRVTVKVKGLRELEREIDRAKRRLGLRMGEFADLSAKVVRDTVVRNAQPFGVGKKSLEKGKGAVRGDLLKIFSVVPESARGRRGVISSVTAARSWHKSRRTGRGRTRGGEKKRVVVSVFRAYLQILLDRVGMAKGSLMGGDDPRLKGRFQKWVSRFKETGSVGRRKRLGGAVWKFKAEPEHVASPGVMGARGVRRVMRVKDRNLKRVLLRREKAELKKAARRMNR